jgi:hypothetical protein
VFFLFLFFQFFWKFAKFSTKFVKKKIIKKHWSILHENMKISDFFPIFCLTKSQKFAPKKITNRQKNHCWHYVKNPLYFWIFSILNSKSNTTNNHFKLGEYYYICLYT